VQGGGRGREGGRGGGGEEGSSGVATDVEVTEAEAAFGGELERGGGTEGGRERGREEGVSV